MYILDSNESGPSDATQQARLDEFLETGPQQVQMLYRARLGNMLAEAKGNSLVHVDPSSQDKRNRILQYRKRGACKKFELPGCGDLISCILWDGNYHITGTDIIKIVEYRLKQQGLIVGEARQKKFEEGVFSDLRHLRPGKGARLEDSRSEFLEWLCRHGCIRTQKKQKVYKWGAVDFDRLTMEAKERLLRRAEEGAPNAANPFTLSQTSLHSCDPLEGMSAGAQFQPIGSLLEGTQPDFYGGYGGSLGEIDPYSESKTGTGTASPSLSHISGSTTDFLDLTDFNMHFLTTDAPTLDVKAALNDSTTQSTMRIISQYQPPKDILTSLQPIFPPTNSGEALIMPAGGMANAPRLIPFHSSTLTRRREDDRRFECNYQFCKRRFKRLEHLKRHLRIHTGERPFTCPVESCGRSFSRSDNLSQHLKIHMSGELSAATTESIGIFKTLAQQTRVALTTNGQLTDGELEEHFFPI
jgi:hypothetical protein